VLWAIENGPKLLIGEWDSRARARSLFARLVVSYQIFTAIHPSILPSPAVFKAVFDRFELFGFLLTDVSSIYGFWLLATVVT
jgi:hypothetical protein